jgi:hypothetical protein
VLRALRWARRIGRGIRSGVPEQALPKVGLVQNRAGAYPEPSFTAVSAAAGALPTMPDDLRVSITDAEGEQAWPVSTYASLRLASRLKASTCRAV